MIRAVIGIAREKRERSINALYTLKGTGLGPHLLTIVENRRRVENVMKILEEAAMQVAQF